MVYLVRSDSLILCLKRKRYVALQKRTHTDEMKGNEFEFEWERERKVDKIKRLAKIAKTIWIE